MAGTRFDPTIGRTLIIPKGEAGRRIERGIEKRISEAAQQKGQPLGKAGPPTDGEAKVEQKKVILTSQLSSLPRSVQEDILAGRETEFILVPEKLKGEKFISFAQARGVSPGQLGKIVHQLLEQPAKERIISRIEVEETQQAREIEQLARERGGEVKFLFRRPGEEEVREFKPGVQPGPEAKIIVEVTSEEPLPEKITVTPKEVLQEQRIRAQAEVVAEKAFERAGPLERAGLIVRTALSPKGFELIGAPFTGKPIEKVVEEKLAEELAIAAVGERIIEFKPLVDVRLPPEVVERITSGVKAPLPTRPGPAVERGIAEFVGSPVFEIETAFLGGAGFARVAATKVGGKILATKVAKVGLGIVGVAFVAGRGLEVKQLIDVGQIERGIGKAISGVAVIGAAVAGARLEARFLAAQQAAKEVRIDLTQIEAETRTAQLREVSVTVGKFKAVTRIGEIRGEVAGAARITEPGKGIIRAVTFIPKQKIGKITVGPEITVRAGTFVQTVKTPTGLGEVFVTETAGLLGEKGISVAETAAIIKQAGVTTRIIMGKGFEVTPRVFEMRGRLDPLRITGITRRGVSAINVQIIKVTDVSAQIKIPDTGFKITKVKPGPLGPKVKTVTKLPEPVVSIPPKITVKVAGALRDISKLAGRAVDIQTGRAISGLGATQVPKTVAPTVLALAFPTVAEITAARKKAEILISARTERLLIQEQRIITALRPGIITAQKDIGKEILISKVDIIPAEIQVTKEKEVLITELEIVPGEITPPPPIPVIPEPRIPSPLIFGLPFLLAGGIGRRAIARRRKFKVRLVKKPIPRIPLIRPIKLKGI